MTVKEVVSLSKVSGCINRCRQSRNLVLVIVFIALFLDNMLLSVVGQYPVHAPSHSWSHRPLSLYFVWVSVLSFKHHFISNGSLPNHWIKRKESFSLVSDTLTNLSIE